MPKSYRAEFFTTADWAKHDFEADSPQQALELAQQFYDQNLGELEFCSNDEIQPLEQIQIWDPEHGTLALWESEDFSLRQSASELLLALTKALAALNAAPRFQVRSLDTDSYAIAALCERAIAKAKGGRP